MADNVIVKDDGPKHTPHDEGQFAAVCADVIDLGECVERYGSNDPKVVRKIVLVFRTEAERDGKPCHISKEFTASMGEKANLRKFLASWRGKSYAQDEAEAGVPVGKMAGVGALLTIEHKKSTMGRTYANIINVGRLPKGMAPPALNGYERPEFWAARKAEYAAGVERHVASSTRRVSPAAVFSDGVPVDTGEGYDPEAPVGDDMDDELPFDAAR